MQPFPWVLYHYYPGSPLELVAYLSLQLSDVERKFMNSSLVAPSLASILSSTKSKTEVKSGSVDGGFIATVVGGGVDVDCCGGVVKDGNDCGMTVENTGEELECNRVGHLAHDCRSPAATNNQRNLTCYECGNQGHYRNDCPKLKNQNHGNQAGVCLDRHLSDHRPILLREFNTDYGATPFRLFHSWFDFQGFDDMITQTWNSISLNDSNAMVHFKKKFQALKKVIRLWIGNYKRNQMNRRTKIKRYIASNHLYSSSFSVRRFSVSEDMLLIHSFSIKKLNLSLGKGLVKMSAS
nr:RNA-directed DNA polymerase, eukaryota, reverse transcriptase zinc-binding domain protein [Tanacetum cinerariifolium]